MNLGGVLVIFVIWWWLAFFALLPGGVRGRWEGEDDGVAGADPGAPRDPQLRRKAIRATIAAAALTAVTAALILSGWFNFRE